MGLHVSRHEPRSGHRWRTVRNEFKSRCKAANAECWLGHHPIRYDVEGLPDSFELDHYQPVSTHPHLVYDPSNFRPSCKRCNRSRGATPPVQGQWVAANW